MHKLELHDQTVSPAGESQTGSVKQNKLVECNSFFAVPRLFGTPLLLSTFTRCLIPMMPAKTPRKQDKSIMKSNKNKNKNHNNNNNCNNNNNTCNVIYTVVKSNVQLQRRKNNHNHNGYKSNNKYNNKYNDKLKNDKNASFRLGWYINALPETDGTLLGYKVYCSSQHINPTSLYHTSKNFDTNHKNTKKIIKSHEKQLTKLTSNKNNNENNNDNNNSNNNNKFLTQKRLVYLLYGFVRSETDGESMDITCVIGKYYGINFDNGFNFGLKYNYFENNNDNYCYTNWLNVNESLFIDLNGISMQTCQNNDNDNDCGDYDDCYDIDNNNNNILDKNIKLSIKLNQTRCKDNSSNLHDEFRVCFGLIGFEKNQNHNRNHTDNDVIANTNDDSNINNNNEGDAKKRSLLTKTEKKRMMSQKSRFLSKIGEIKGFSSIDDMWGFCSEFWLNSIKKLGIENARIIQMQCNKLVNKNEMYFISSQSNNQHCGRIKTSSNGGGIYIQDTRFECKNSYLNCIVNLSNKKVKFEKVYKNRKCSIDSMLLDNSMTYIFAVNVTGCQCNDSKCQGNIYHIDISQS